MLHAASLATGLWLESHRPGHLAYGFWSNWFESLSLFSLLIVVVFLAVQTRQTWLFWGRLFALGCVLDGAGTHPGLFGQSPLSLRFWLRIS